MSQAQTIVLLFRHGQTNGDFNPDATIDGERVLTEQGRGEIGKVGEYLKSFAPSIIYSSPLKRAVQTAEIIQETAAIPGQIHIEPLLVEMYHGRGEYADRATAIQEFFRVLTTAHAGEQIVLVSHQDPLETIVQHFGFTPAELSPPCRMGQGYRVVFVGETPVECQKINPAGV